MRPMLRKNRHARSRSTDELRREIKLVPIIIIILRFKKIKGCEHGSNSAPHRRIGNVSSRADPEVAVSSDHVQRGFCLPSPQTEGEWTRKITLNECTIFLNESFRFELEWFRVSFLVASKAPVEVVKGSITQMQTNLNPPYIDQDGGPYTSDFRE
jgi:hypothetical protein